MKTTFEFEIKNQAEQNDVLKYITPLFPRLNKITLTCSCGASTETSQGDDPIASSDKDADFIELHSNCKEKELERCQTTTSQIN